MILDTLNSIGDTVARTLEPVPGMVPGLVSVAAVAAVLLCWDPVEHRPTIKATACILIAIYVGILVPRVWIMYPTPICHSGGALAADPPGCRPYTCTPLDATICRHMNCANGLMENDPWCTDTYRPACDTYRWFWAQPYNASNLVTYFAHCGGSCSRGYINETSFETCDERCVQQLQEVHKASEAMWLGTDWVGYSDWVNGIQYALLHRSIVKAVHETNTYIAKLAVDIQQQRLLMSPMPCGMCEVKRAIMTLVTFKFKDDHEFHSTLICQECKQILAKMTDTPTPVYYEHKSRKLTFCPNETTDS